MNTRTGFVRMLKVSRKQGCEPSCFHTGWWFESLCLPDCVAYSWVTNHHGTLMADKVFMSLRGLKDLSTVTHTGQPGCNSGLTPEPTFSPSDHVKHMNLQACPGVLRFSSRPCEKASITMKPLSQSSESWERFGFPVSGVITVFPVMFTQHCSLLSVQYSYV